MAMKKTVEFAQSEQLRILREEEDYRETKRCENSCAHFDLINQCCWLITSETPGLMTNVQEGDYCFHGLKEEY